MAAGLGDPFAAAYSVDLRIRVVETADGPGLSDGEAAETFRVGEATVRR